MTKEDALKILNALVKNQNLVRHHLAAGACMKALAKKLKQNEDKWELTGLLHDADYELTKDRPAEHGIIIGDKVRSLDGPLPDDVFEAIKFHNKEYTHAAESLMGWGIYTCDELTGIIVACALVRPDKKLSSVDADFVLRKIKEASFAKGALRERIYLCEEKLNITLPEFVEICLKAMQGIATELGL